MTNWYYQPPEVMIEEARRLQKELDDAARRALAAEALLRRLVDADDESRRIGGWRGEEIFAVEAGRIADEAETLLGEGTSP